MAVEVKIPEVGESITEGFLAEWLQPDGAVVAVEDPLLVLETDKITMNVNAEHAGKLTRSRSDRWWPRSTPTCRWRRQRPQRRSQRRRLHQW
jgi:hypothetical protein